MSELGPPPYDMDTRWQFKEGDWIGRRITFGFWLAANDPSKSLLDKMYLYEDMMLWLND